MSWWGWMLLGAALPVGVALGWLLWGRRPAPSSPPSVRPLEPVAPEEPGRLAGELQAVDGKDREQLLEDARRRHEARGKR